MSSRIFVKGLPTSLTVEEFRRHFSQQSPITDAKFIPRRRIGYVGFKTPEDARQAVKYHNRSFIRMSKIEVELAKSVEEQQRSSKPRTRGANTSSKVQEDTRSRSADVTEHSAKRRRICAQDEEGDEKLQEFIQVMQRPSKSKTWQIEDLLAPSTKVGIESEAQNLPTATMTGDEEYESVPKQQQKLSRIDLTIPSSMPSAEPLDSNLENALNVKNKDNDANAPTVTDDDWLRARTSRLLGLVDDVDTPDMATLRTGQPKLESADKEETPKSDNEESAGSGVESRGGALNVTTTEPIETVAGKEEPASATGRLFIRNLTYTVTEDDIREHFESNGYEGIEEVHLPLDIRSGNNNNKGFAHVQFKEVGTAARALQDLDQRPFQGRLLHILPSNSRKPEVLDEFTISKLPLKQQQQIRRKAEAASSTFNWNSLYMNSDAVISSISDRLGISKSELLDPTSSDAAVRQAHAETHVIQETKSFFMANGINLDAFKQNVRGNTAILVKNFPFGTKVDELNNLFCTYGSLKQLLMPPSGTIAIVEFDQCDHARSAFGSLAYSKFRGSILFLEKAPKNLFTNKANDVQVWSGGSEAQPAKPTATELLQHDGPDVVTTSTLFVRNLNFTTSDEVLRDTFKSVDGFLSARIKRKPDPKKAGQTLSMGFGFLEFRTQPQAQAALAATDGYKLEGHELLIRASHKAIDAAEERRREDRAKKVAGQHTKIIIKNLPFEASKKDVRSLFSAYGQLRSVRVPKRFDSSTRGFAFAEFTTAREAGNAMEALKDTHLLGRRLVLQFVAEEAVDPEAEIEQMQQKVGRQADKVALQNLTGPGRKKFHVEGADGLDQL